MSTSLFGLSCDHLIFYNSYFFQIGFYFVSYLDCPKRTFQKGFANKFVFKQKFKNKRFFQKKFKTNDFKQICLKVGVNDLNQGAHGWFTYCVCIAVVVASGVVRICAKPLNTRFVVSQALRATTLHGTLGTPIRQLDKGMWLTSSYMLLQDSLDFPRDVVL